MMGPTWSLSVFLLGYVFGMPIIFHNSTRQNETLVQLNYTLDNSTEQIETLVQLNYTLDNPTEFVGTNDTGISPYQMIFPTHDLFSTGENLPDQLPLDSQQQRKDNDYNFTTGVPSWNGTESDGNRTNTTKKQHPPVLSHSPPRGASRPSSCQLSICALINLSHEMQSGGDERAGRATTDPHGIGKR